MNESAIYVVKAPVQTLFDGIKGIDNLESIYIVWIEEENLFFPLSSQMFKQMFLQGQTVSIYDWRKVNEQQQQQWQKIPVIIESVAAVDIRNHTCEVVGINKIYSPEDTQKICQQQGEIFAKFLATEQALRALAQKEARLKKEKQFLKTVLAHYGESQVYRDGSSIYSVTADIETLENIKYEKIDVENTIDLV